MGGKGAGADRYLFGVIAEQRADRRSLELVVVGRGGAVRVDIGNVLRLNARIAHGFFGALDDVPSGDH